MAKTTKFILETLNAEKERLFQYASYRLHDIRDVEDVLQNIYVKILDNPLRFNRVDNKRAYLYRILSNECTDYLRNNGKTEFLYDQSLDTFSLDTLQPENFEEEFAMINRILAHCKMSPLLIQQTRDIHGSMPITSSQFHPKNNPVLIRL